MVFVFIWVIGVFWSRINRNKEFDKRGGIFGAKTANRLSNEEFFNHVVLSVLHPGGSGNVILCLLAVLVKLRDATSA